MRKTFIILVSGVFITSSGSIIIRWIGDVPFTTIAFYRLFLSAIALGIFYSLSPSRKIRNLGKMNWHYPLAGIFLAAHLVTWIASLQITSIASSIFLESTHPLFSVLVSIIFLKEKPEKAIIPVFIGSLFGMLLIVYGDWGHGESRLLGDLLAVLSAMFLSLYLLIARYHRGEKDFVKYLFHVYGAGATACAIYMYANNIAFTGFPVESWIFIGLLALGPNLLGHSMLNWASRHMEIFKVNLTMLLEPILATLSGIILLAEFPNDWFYPGAFLIIISIGFLFYKSATRLRSLAAE